MSLKDFNIALLAIILFASNVIILKEASSYCSLDVFNTLRFSIFIFTIPFLKISRSKIIHLMIFSFFNCFLNFIFISKAISSGILPSHIGLLSVPRVVFVILLAYLLINEKINFYQLLGMGISCLALILFKLDFLNDLYQLSFFYVVLSALSWAIAVTILKKNNVKLTLPDICFANAISAPPMIIYTLLTNDININWAELMFNLNFIKLVIYAAFVPILFATFLWQNLLLKYKSIQLNPIMNLFPFIVFLESILFLDERFNWKFLGLLILLFFALLMCQNIKFFFFKNKFLKYLK